MRAVPSPSGFSIGPDPTHRKSAKDGAPHISLSERMWQLRSWKALRKFCDDLSYNLWSPLNEQMRPIKHRYFHLRHDSLKLYET